MRVALLLAVLHAAVLVPPRPTACDGDGDVRVTLASTGRTVQVLTVVLFVPPAAPATPAVEPVDGVRSPDRHIPPGRRATPILSARAPPSRSLRG